MTKQKSTKRALLMSALALLMCVSMLIGSTFAWFTDSVTTGSNVIQSGKLDIVLEYWTGTEWADAEGVKLDFQKASTSGGSEVLWEPGCTYELPKIRVRNEGNLAAYVVLRLNGVTGDEKLMEAIELKTKVSNIPETILNGSQAASYSKFLNEPVDMIYGTPDGTVIFDWSLMGKGMVSPNSGHTDTSAEFTITGHMKEEAGNEYQGLKIEGISITALATQQVYEYDSHGRDYDEDAVFDGEISTLEAFKNALKKGGSYKLKADIANDVAESFEIAEGATVELDLNGYTVTNAVEGAPAIVNNGTLKISGDGAVVNGTSTVAKSHTIRNYGLLEINGGSIGTDATAGAAVVNDGTAVINGGTFASKQEDTKSDGLCAYVFINNGSGTMTINDATFDGQTHGLFGAYDGKIIVNGGNYTMDGNGGLGCYVVYATGDAEVVLVGGTVRTNEPRSDRVFFVYNNGNLFNEEAVASDNITYIGTTIYLNDVEQAYTDGAISYVSSADELSTAMGNGGYIVLKNDMELSSNLTVATDTVLYGQGNTVTFTDNTKITVSADSSLEIVGATLDADGEYYFDEDGSIVYNERRTTPLLNSGAGSTLVLGQGTVIENVVATGSAVVSAKGTDDNRAKVILQGATIQNCAGQSGTIINVDHAGDVVIEDGTVITGNASYNNSNHGIIRVYNAWDAANPSTVTMNGGEISGNYYSGNGLVGLYYGKMTMNGGKICDNAWFEDNQKSNGFYPVIYVHSNSQFVMNGGEISGNSVRFGVLNCLNSAIEPAIIINGGTVINNTNTDNNTEAFVAALIEEDGKIYKSVSISSDANVSGMVWDYYTGYYTIDEYFAKVN